MPPKARGAKSTKHVEAPPRPASAAGGKQQRSRSAQASRRALVPSRRSGDDEDDDDGDDADPDADDDDDELPVLTLDEEEEVGRDGESSDDGSDGELGGARGHTFGAAFRDALVAGGDRAEDAPELGGERLGSRQRSGEGGGAAATAQTRVTGAAALPDGAIVPRAETVRRRGRDGQQRRKAALLGDAAFVADRGSDSSDDERGVRNKVGNVPAQWYAGEEHVGYDVEGKKLLRSRKGAPGDALEAHLAKQDSSRAWRTLYDPVNDETYTLTAEEVALIQRLRDGGVPGGDGDFDPYAPALDWADFDGLLATNGVVHPISSGPEPKRRFVPSAWEAKRVVKLIRALRRGWIKPAAERAAAAAAKAAAHGAPYLLWDDDAGASSKTAAGLARIAPPQERLPGHEESYNPPLEYIPTEEEVKEMQKQEEFTGRKAFIPKRYANMRSIPAYERFIHERFERCLDLYLCPRVARQRLQVDPKSLLPELPKPSELRPFPSALGIEYKQPSDDGPPVRLNACSVHHTGAWLAAGDTRARVHVWEVSTGRLVATIQLDDVRDGSGVSHLSWCPASGTHLLAVTVAQRLLLLACSSHLFGKADAASSDKDLFPWSSTSQHEQHWQMDTQHAGSAVVALPHMATRCAWHWQGDYLATVCPSGASSAVLIHQRSKGATQALFKRNKGHVADVAFHPARPLLFVATRKHVYIYNLAKQALSKTLQAGCGPLTSLSVHPRGDNVLASSDDKRVAWFDLDLGTRPYKTFASHAAGVQAASFHPRYPLFASGAHDGACHVFHGRVYDDLATNPLIVPLKVLRAHEMKHHTGVTSLAWHPQQPWLITTGGDGLARLWVNM